MKTNKKLKAIEGSKGRFFGMETNDGRVFNARLVKMTPQYLTVWDRNSGSQVKVSKSNVSAVRVGGKTYAS